MQPLGEVGPGHPWEAPARAALAQAQAEVLGWEPSARFFLASVGPDPATPDGPGLTLRAWYTLDPRRLWGLRAWCDAREGLSVAEGVEVAWTACEAGRGLRELLRQSLGGLETLAGAPLPLEHGEAWARELRELGGGALCEGSVKALAAGARGLWLSGRGRGAARWARMGLRLAHEGALCGSQEALERWGQEALGGLDGEGLVAAVEGAQAEALGSSASGFVALERWLSGVRLGRLVG